MSDTFLVNIEMILGQYEARGDVTRVGARTFELVYWHKAKAYIVQMYAKAYRPERQNHNAKFTTQDPRRGQQRGCWP